MTKLNRGAALLLVPGLGIFLAFLVLPLATIVEKSFRLFEPGRVGAAEDAPYTLFNYAELFDQAYLYYFATTVRFGVVSTLAALLLAFPIAYFVARQRSLALRKFAVGFFDRHDVSQHAGARLCIATYVWPDWHR